jgi:hypothetical protein
LDLVGVGQPVGGDDRVQVDAVPSGHVAQPIAVADGVQHAVLGRDLQLLADQQQVGVGDLVGPQDRLGPHVVLLGDLPQHLALGHRVGDHAAALGRRRQRVRDVREG